MTCETCGQSFDASATTCPYCRAPVGMGGLARGGGGEDLLEHGRDRSTENLLARADDNLEDLLVRDLGGPLSPGELRDALVRVDAQADPTLADLEGSLARDAAIALDGIALSELVDKSGNDMKVVKRGLTFLKNKRFTEALEWWGLHREGLGDPRPVEPGSTSGPSRDRFELLLLLLEAFTHRLAGDPRRAAAVSQRIITHPLYKRMRGQR